MTPPEGREIASATILVITRDTEFLNSLRLILGDRRYQLSSSEAFGRGLKELADRLEPDLVIVDVQMPLMTGIKTALRLHRWSSVRTVLLTSWEAGQDTLRRLDVSEAGGLSAPISPGELVEWIDSIVKREKELRPIPF